MTQEQAIQRGYTHFIEVWRYKDSDDKENMGLNNKQTINLFNWNLEFTNSRQNIYTIAIFLIKPKQ